jgi:hypothetical protein
MTVVWTTLDDVALVSILWIFSIPPFDLLLGYPTDLAFFFCSLAIVVYSGITFTRLLDPVTFAYRSYTLRSPFRPYYQLLIRSLRNEGSASLHRE